MPVAVLQKKIALLPQNYLQEVSDFVDTLLQRAELVENKMSKIELAKSLIGSVPSEVSFDDARNERLSKI